MTDLQPQIKILDISDPAHPRVTGFIYEQAEDLELAGNLLYLTGMPDASLKIYDISNPRTPVLAGVCSKLLYINGRKLAVGGNMVYLAGNGKIISRIDVTNPALPVYKGSFTAGDELQDVVVSGNYLFTAMGPMSDCVLIYSLN